MRRRLCLLCAGIICLVSIFCFAGCEEPKEVKSQVVIDKQYEPPYSYMVTETFWWCGELVTQSIPKQMPERYYVKIQVIYVDDSTSVKSVTVNKTVWERTIIGEEWRG